MEEIWKDVKGYEGLYQVSNLGRVKSYLGLKTRILKHGKTKAGYLVLNLRKHNKSKTFYIHKLVATAFLGHDPCGHELVVDHIDDNKLNNNVNNLQIITQRGNAYKTQGKYSSKYKGVYFNKKSGKFYARIYLNGINIHIGTFSEEIDAHKAYQKELKKLVH